MESHIAHLRVAMKKWTLQELVVVRTKWQVKTTPPEYRKLIDDEIKYRDGRLDAIV